MKCPHCKKEIEVSENWLKIPELGIEVEKEVHNKNKSWENSNLKSREDELLTAEQCIWLANSKYAKELKMDGSSSNDDFFIKQPFNNGRVARFVAVSDGAILYCNGSPDGSSPALGVRFVRKISKKVKK